MVVFGVAVVAVVLVVFAFTGAFVALELREAGETAVSTASGFTTMGDGLGGGTGPYETGVCAGGWMIFENCPLDVFCFFGKGSAIELLARVNYVEEREEKRSVQR